MKLWAFEVIIRVAILAVFGWLCAGTAHGQAAPTGAIHGQVLDPSGAAVVGASVIVTTPDAQTLGAVANQQGAFDLKGLAAGTYKVEVIARGFTPYSNEAVAVAAGQTQQLKISLEIEVQQQQVVVNDSPVAVDTNPANNAGAVTLSGKDLDALPDDPDELQTDLQALAGPSAGPNGGQFYIDGFTGGQLPPKSAIREIRINSNPFSAQYDKVGYGRIEIFTKPGTDKWHGQVSINGNASGLNSKNPFFDASAATTGYPSYYSTQYSGNVGGPLSKKASFFTSVDIRDINDLSIVNAEVLDASNNPVPFSAAIPEPRRRYNVGPKLDYALTPTNTLSVRYQYWRNTVDNNGIGQFSLPSEGYNTGETEQTLQASDTQIFGTKVVNETRFQYIRDTNDQVPLSTDPTVIVPLAFNGGGSPQGTLHDTTNRYEFQNYTSIQLTNHLVKFGARLRGVTDNEYSSSGFNGSYYFPSLTAYQQTVQGLGPFAAQYSVTTAPFNPSNPVVAPNPYANIGQVDVGLYAEDDWKIRPNITLSYGLRFESQNNMSNHADWAPRLGFAWGIGGGGKSAPKTVLRAGFGIFYDRFDESNALEENRLNGTNLTEFVVTNPNFYLTPPPLVPSPTTLATLYQADNRLKAPGTMQTALSLERQLTKWANLTVSYINSRGWDQFLTNNINTPVGYTFPYYLNPGTGTRAVPNSNIYQFQSEANFRENQMFIQSTVRAGAKVTMFAYYTLTYANSDTAGINSFPSNPSDIAQDYGRAAFDIRNRFFLGGSIGLPYGFRLSPFMIAQSGIPYSITLSDDLVGSSQFNQRPSLATGPAGGPVVTVPGFGTYNTLPAIADEIPINSLTSDGRFTLNLRLSKTFGFGRDTKQQNNGGGGGGRGPGGGGGRGGGSPFGGGPGFGGGGDTTRRYSFTLSVNARNIFNNVNTAVPGAVLNPPSTVGGNASYSTQFFGIPNQLATGPFSSGTANRQLYLQASFSF